MDFRLASAFICFGLSALILAIIVIIASRAKLRTTLWWAGLAFLPAGVWLARFDEPLAHTTDAFAQWYYDTWLVGGLQSSVLTGIILLIVGALVMFISRLMPHRPKVTAPVAEPDHTENPASTPSNQQGTADQSTPSSQPTPDDLDADR